jgi:hypothetical protein
VDVDLNELEMFRKLFTQCSIWRGGLQSQHVDADGHQHLKISLAFMLKNGKTDYLDLDLKFDDGNWVDTRKL